MTARGGNGAMDPAPEEDAARAAAIEAAAAAGAEAGEALAEAAYYGGATDGGYGQMPPADLDEERVLGSIDYEKDVDGFHPLNIGRLSQRGREPLFVPCTPRALLHLDLPSSVDDPSDATSPPDATPPALAPAWVGPDALCAFLDGEARTI